MAEDSTVSPKPRYNFTKPNDIRAIRLMNVAAVSVIKAIPDICIAYGASDEYSFVLRRDSSLFDRRASKLISTIVSMFTAQYIFRWPEFMVDVKLDETKGLPSFDGRAVEFPATIKLKVDCMSIISPPLKHPHD
jgi:tRNA(His) guanylyltransferase